MCFTAAACEVTRSWGGTHAKAITDITFLGVALWNSSDSILRDDLITVIVSTLTWNAEITTPAAPCKRLGLSAGVSGRCYAW